MFIIVSIEGQFISHCVESGSHLRFNYALLTIGFVFISIGNDIGETGSSSLSSALEVNSTLTSLDLRMSLNLNDFFWFHFCISHS